MDLSLNQGTLVVTGGPGDSLQTAIVIRKTPRGLSAAGAEHLLLVQRYGGKGDGWRLKSGDFLLESGRTYDVYTVTIADGRERRIYFDVTDWLTHVKEAL